MTGPKLNEGALLIPEGQPTTKATAKYVRGSASKAREVLDLIRGLDVRRADEVLQFTTRDVARDVRKVLASAVANAVHNDSQDGDELFVLAAFADEGPTLRRFRPRARGRATRIRKRTCHLTVVVARLSDERLEVLQNRQQATTPAGRRRAGTSADSRRARVERSRTRAQGLRDQPVEPADEAGETLDTEEIETTDGVATFADVTPERVDTAAETEAAVAGGELLEAAAGDTGSADEASGAQADDVAGADVVGAETAEPETAEAGTVELPAGAVPAPPDGSVPEGHEIKANASSKMYHVPGSRYYEVTIGELFFDTPEHARAAGYQPPAGAAGQEN